MQMSLSISMILLVLILGCMYTGQAQMCSRNVNNNNVPYTQYDSTTQSCECRQNKCYFCFEIEQRHTFTRYYLTEGGTQIPGYGGRVWVPNISTGKLEEYPPEIGDMPLSCEGTACTDAYIADGYSFRPILTINNIFPGPTLIVPYKAMVQVDVYNNLSSEATSIHWHGMHQMNTPWMDGVEHITQCGIAPSSSFRYRFEAYPSDTHWYHSHSGAQRTDGLFGALIVRENTKPVFLGIGSSFRDEPAQHTLTLLDWQKSNSLDLFVEIHAGIRFFDTEVVPSLMNSDPRQPRTCSPDGIEVGPVPFWSGLINGRGKHPQADYKMTNLSTFAGEPGNFYRFRLIGAQSLYAYRFSIDEHKLRLIATDGHILEPETVDFIIIHSGERYDFLLETKNSMEIASKRNFFIRAETLEVKNSTYCGIGNNNKLFPLFTDHKTEAILYYDNDIPTNSMYKDINSMPKYSQCEQNGDCVAINCPFERFSDSYGIRRCIHTHELYSLLPTDTGDLPVFTNATTEFFDFGFEGDGSTSAINGKNFVFPSVPLQIDMRKLNAIPNICKLGDANRDGRRDKCDARDRLVTPDCLCTHVVNIEQGQTYQFVFTAVGPTRVNWNFAHPVHLHGHSFHVAKIGFGTYSDATARIQSATEDIKCEYNNVENENICTNPQWSSENVAQTRNDRLEYTPHKDTVLVPAGGYAVVYFKANNPGYWFLHCHIEVHQLEGMAVVINEAGNSQNAPLDIPRCGTQQAKETKWFKDWTISLGVVLSFIIVAETIAFIVTCIVVCIIYYK